MSAISLKSITGITSITTPAGVDNQLTLHNNNTSEAVKLDVAGNVHINNQLVVTGVTTFASDTHIADSIIHTGDTNTKIRFPGADTITAETAGSEVLRITSDRKVGINRTSPARHLHAYAAGAGFVAKFEGSYSYSAVEFADSGTTNAPYIGSKNDHFTIATGGNNERLRIKSDGGILQTKTGGNANFTISRNESVGTTDQQIGVLDFASNTGHTVQARVGAKTLGTSNVGGDLVVETRADGGSLTEKFRITGGGVLQVASGGNLEMSSNGRIFVGNGGNETNPMFANVSDTNTGIAFPAADTMMFTTGGTERLRITSGGKIGINQSGPFADVDITSSVEDTDNSSLAQHGIRLAHIGAANEEVIPITAGFVSQQNRARAGIGFISKTISGADGMGGAIGFYTRNTADGHALYRADERVRITESGQFLVGATSSSGARAIIQQNSSDTNPLDQQTSADSSGLRIQNYSFGVGRYSALSLECASASQVQSASIISQSVSSGVSPDIIIAQRTSVGANSERLRINSDGYVVKGSGLTCAFNVSGTNMTRSDTSAYVCDFDDDSSSGHFDSGNNFNTSTHKFVAPVSGYYYFFTNIRLDSFNSGYIRTAILSTSYHAGTTYYTLPVTGHVITYADNGAIQTVQTSTVMYLPATHEAWVYQNPNSDTSYTVYLNESSFGGYFIG